MKDQFYGQIMMKRTCRNEILDSIKKNRIQISVVSLSDVVTILANEFPDPAVNRWGGQLLRKRTWLIFIIC